MDDIWKQSLWQQQEHAAPSSLFLGQQQGLTARWVAKAQNT